MSHRRGATPLLSTSVAVVFVRRTVHDGTPVEDDPYHPFPRPTFENVGTRKSPSLIIGRESPLPARSGPLSVSPSYTIASRRRPNPRKSRRSWKSGLRHRSLHGDAERLAEGSLRAGSWPRRSFSMITARMYASVHVTPAPERLRLAVILQDLLPPTTSAVRRSRFLERPGRERPERLRPVPSRGRRPRGGRPVSGRRRLPGIPRGTNREAPSRRDPVIRRLPPRRPGLSSAAFFGQVAGPVGPTDHPGRLAIGRTS